jgi:hypothetical protein
MEHPSLKNFIIKNWQEAEKNVRNDIRSFCPKSYELFVTELFHLYLCKAFQKNHPDLRQCLISDALPAVLEKQELRNSIEDFCGKISLQVVLHKLSSEARTGGDLGVIVGKPIFSGTSGKIFLERQGVVCQAKMKDERGHWNPLSTSQVGRLKDGLDTFACLLYDYGDWNGERRFLNGFRWAIFRKNDIDLVNTLNFDSIQATEYLSKDFIENLFLGNIGSNDEDRINTCVLASGNPYLEIIIMSGPDEPMQSGHVLGDVNALASAQEEASTVQIVGNVNK